MKARALREILGGEDLGYSIADYGDYIGIGNGYVHNLISVDKKTLEIKYALDTWRKGRASLGDKEFLGEIWDKLQSLIDSGEIKEIIEGVDELENPLPVYTYDGGKIIESTTDKYGWPNVTFNGKMMYKNTHFKTRMEAIEYAIQDNESGVEWRNKRIREFEKKIEELRLHRNECMANVFTLRKLRDEENNGQ